MLAGFHKDLLGVVVGPGKADLLGFEEIKAWRKSVIVVGTSRCFSGAVGQTDGSPHEILCVRLAYRMGLCCL
jgi:L-asparaginase/Glu-tRNA(Gln) amidotransferase subunit D